MGCNSFHRIYLFTSLLMLSEQVIEDSTILLVNPLHLVDVLGHLLIIIIIIMIIIIIITITFSIPINASIKC